MAALMQSSTVLANVYTYKSGALSERRRNAIQMAFSENPLIQDFMRYSANNVCVTDERTDGCIDGPMPMHIQRR